MRICLLALLLCSWSSLGGLAAAAFPGWQALRVVEQEGRPFVMRSGDVDGDGRQELIVVNQRFSRLETYHWLRPEEREEKVKSDEGRRPNELPMASEFKREEIQLEQLPQDLILEDLDGDDRPELVVLVGPANRVIVYSRDGERGWKKEYQRNLLEGSIPQRRRAMLVRRLKDGKREVLISCSNGIQQLSLDAEAQPEWLSPREERDRLDWWLVDLDGDGDEDLVEQTRESNEAVRWYRCSGDGNLLPAQVLFDRAVQGVEVLRGDGPAELVLLESSARTLLRRYKLGSGQDSPLGQRQALALVGGRNAAWCGMQQGDTPALVLLDPNRPRILSYSLSEEGWKSEVAFPAIGNVVAVTAPVASPGTLLLRVKDGADLYMTKWNEQRLTYPKPWPQSAAADADDRQIVGLGQVGGQTWWVQRVASRLDLYRWEKDADEPSLLRFAGVGNKVDEALWIGGERLLVKQTHARGLRFVTRVDEGEDKAVSSQPSQLKRADLGEFQLFAVGDEARVGRFVDGVLQWLDEDLQPYEQIMLPAGQQLGSYVPQGANGGWGLQKGSPFMHRLEADEAGVVRSTDRFEVVAGELIVDDPYLGLLMVNRDRVIRLRPGVPQELELVGTIDERVGEEGGVRETRFHRLDAVDLDGDDCRELILHDDLDHRLTALERVDDQVTPAISWQVFDDKKYPYGDDTDDLVREPRAIVGLDFDGDQHQDLALLCHDRLLVYLGRME